MEPVTVSETRRNAIVGCLLGTAVGDALGLPAEGLSRPRQRRLFGQIKGHRLLFGHGLLSDDTEHTILTAQALLAGGDSPCRFADALAAKLRRWLLLLPAGAGLATLRACLKLLAGVSPERSGVWSAGNGPAMRSALLGVCYGTRTETLKSFVRAGSRLTHTDPRAEYGALAIALAAHWSANRCTDLAAYLGRLRDALPDDENAGELLRLLTLASDSALRAESTAEYSAAVFARTDRVTGYVYQTVPAAVHAWMRYPTDFQSAVLGSIACGGDTDTLAAITGAIVASGVGEQGIPREWVTGLADRPYTPAWIRTLGECLASQMAGGTPQKPPEVPMFALMLRNVFFLFVVLLTLLRWYCLDLVYLLRSLRRGSSVEG
jgi:ADP-ribosylglycohydrolase